MMQKFNKTIGAKDSGGNREWPSVESVKQSRIGVGRRESKRIDIGAIISDDHAADEYTNRERQTDSEYLPGDYQQE